MVSNAIKFTNRGGQVIISAKPASDQAVEISVADNGIGMSRKILDKLFRTDENVSRKGTEGESSSGLGLILCEEFVEKNGGRLWVEPEDGQGSIFYFTIPKANKLIIPESS